MEGRGKNAVRTNPINQMKQWAAHCEKELAMSDKWFENWSEVYFPGQKVGEVEDRVAELERRAEELNEKIVKTKVERAKIKIETFDSPFRVKSSQELKAAYPHISK